ncbi:MAG: hypothetical protein ACQET6_11375 [Bacillota bacterium]|uniref:hypothetical protein n=1 Tax=Rossellomorea sp. FM04394 TaxID=3243076 RepID=UPI0035A6CED5
MENPMLAAVKTLLKETFEGPEGNGSWYTESKPRSGLFGTLEELSAEDASIPVNGTTIAAQTDHTRYYIWVVRSHLNGEVPDKDWEASWKITSVDTNTWTQFTSELQQEYTALLTTIDSVTSLDEQTLSGMLGAIAHSAYHLGSIRQMVKAIKVPSQS